MASATGDLHKFGVFSSTGYTTISDPYVKKGSLDSRYKGKQFEIRVPKIGKGRDVTFTPPPLLFEGEKYTTLAQTKLQWKRESKAAQKNEDPFKPPQPPKKTTGLGTYYGTVGGKFEHMDEGLAKATKKGDVVNAPPNIMTTPAKRGTFGFPGITLGKYGTSNGTRGVVGEYVYASDPYEGARHLEVEARMAEKKKMASENPFKPCNPLKKGTYGVPGTTINSHSNLIVKDTAGVVGEYKYEPLGPPPQRRAHSEAAGGEGAKADERDPFKPPAPPKTGPYATIGKYPPFMNDPYELKELAAQRELKADKERRIKDHNFKPSSCPKSSPTPSVFRMNIR